MPERLSHKLIEFFRRHREKALPLALITVLRTEGSTYSKAGNQVLVNADGELLGMLSGGCLEGDLAERARSVLSTGVDALVDYDLRDDDVFGLGVGCEGVLHILIQALSVENDYEPLAGLVCAFESASQGEIVLQANDEALGVVSILAPLRVLVLGAGQDAEPLLLFGGALGWELVVSDHRPAVVSRLPDGAAARVHCAPFADVAAELDLDYFDAVIVMSHNLDADRAYLAALARSKIGFIGLLGPPHRRDRLLQDLGVVAEQLGSRLRSPVGRQIGGRGPAAIALEVAAEVQAHFYV